MKINSFLPVKHKYLKGLLSIVEKPKLLYAIGDLPGERIATVAVVGTRSPTPYGRQVAFDFAYRLAKAGIVVVSGLAYGIDRIAHEAALEAHGTTIAVLAGGLDAIYPASHQTLAHKIIQSGGALLSEYPEGTPALKHQFLQRNRLVSGLADAIIVIEAGERSGTNNTVMYALEQGKEVFAIPGPITSSQSIGPNRLIQQGAHPALTPDDILRVIAPQAIQEASTIPQADTPEENVVLQLIYNGTNDGSALLQASGLDAAQFARTLTMLEINGLIRSLGANRWAHT